MTPLTPFIESPTGRLTELVYLLTDRPLSLAHQAVIDAEAGDDAEVLNGDPWYVVASALHRLGSMDESTLRARRQEQPEPTPHQKEAERQLVTT